MSDTTEVYRKAADAISVANRRIKRLVVIFGFILLAAALVVIVTAEVRFANQVNVIKTRQIEFHRDSTCQTQALDLILTELAEAQQAQLHRQRPPPFFYPTPC